MQPPDEVLLQIFRYLPLIALVHASAVCKVWRNLLKGRMNEGVSYHRVRVYSIRLVDIREEFELDVPICLSMLFL
jgi:hypothetical protein